VTSIQAHADAGLNLLRADVQLVVHDGQVPHTSPLPAPPYVVAYVYRELPDGLAAPDKVALDGRSTVVNMRMILHCVGANAVAARAVAGRAENALLDVVPVVAGRTCSPIRWAESGPPNLDEETGATYVDLVDVYTWFSVPA
jgi:hypothetical protein